MLPLIKDVPDMYCVYRIYTLKLISNQVMFFHIFFPKDGVIQTFSSSQLSLRIVGVMATL